MLGGGFITRGEGGSTLRGKAGSLLSRKRKRDEPKVKMNVCSTYPKGKGSRAKKTTHERPKKEQNAFGKKKGGTQAPLRGECSILKGVVYYRKKSQLAVKKRGRVTREEGRVKTPCLRTKKTKGARVKVANHQPIKTWIRWRGEATNPPLFQCELESDELSMERKEKVVSLLLEKGKKKKAKGETSLGKRKETCLQR